MANQQLSKHQKEQIERHVQKQFSEHVLTKAEFFGAQFKHHVSTAIIAAFSFLIALTWKDLTVHAIETIFTTELRQKIPYLPDLIAAIVVTIIAVLGIILVTRWAKKPEVIISETNTSN